MDISKLFLHKAVPILLKSRESMRTYAGGMSPKCCNSIGRRNAAEIL